MFVTMLDDDGGREREGERRREKQKMTNGT